MNIGEMQRALSLMAEKTPNHKFDDLYSLVCRKDWLRLACDYVAQNAGSKTAGCDGITMSEFEEDRERNLTDLQEALQSETFVACPVRRVYIPKSNGKVRPLGIPSIRDRIVQEAVRMILEPIYETGFSQYSFGFRPNRCTMDAIRAITQYTKENMKFFWVIEGDISAYFDTINHRKLMKFLRRRVRDERLLNLIRLFLRAGVMDRRLFKDTTLGTPQGGIISPLLANVYLHELDMFMQRYTTLSLSEKRVRRRTKLANFAYIRYADDFVILTNGTKEQAETMREGVRNFLTTTLHLTLSMEKTRITHLNDGFDFLGFRVYRGMGHNGMKTKVLISVKGQEKHLNALRDATSRHTHEDSVTLKIKALNRVIAGWCRYYQYTSKARTQFGKLAHRTFWLMAHWLGRKFQLTMPGVMRRFCKDSRLTDGTTTLISHGNFPTLRYGKRYLKPNPYTTQERIEREELLDENPWSGFEDRPGWADLKQQVLERDDWTCRICKAVCTPNTCQVDHIRQYHSYKRPVDANRLENLWTLCIPCHRRKTESEQQMESRVL
jgi:group II intron reverse transcriptase/maturase